MLFKDPEYKFSQVCSLLNLTQVSSDSTMTFLHSYFQEFVYFKNIFDFSIALTTQDIFPALNNFTIQCCKLYTKKLNRMISNEN